MIDNNYHNVITVIRHSNMVNNKQQVEKFCNRNETDQEECESATTKKSNQNCTPNRVPPILVYTYIMRLIIGVPNVTNKVIANIALVLSSQHLY